MRARLLALLFVTACGSTGPGGLVGTYTLQSVDGLPLPIPMERTGATAVALTGISLSVQEKARWQTAVAFTQTVNGQTTDNSDMDGGTWALTRKGLTLTSAMMGSAGYRGTVRGSMLTLTDGTGRVHLFSR